MKSLNIEKLVAAYISQARSTDLWVGIWNKGKDISGAKNALFALGKLAGVYGVLLVAHGDENLPEEIIALNTGYSQKWEEIMQHEFRIRHGD